MSPDIVAVSNREMRRAGKKIHTLSILLRHSARDGYTYKDMLTVSVYGRNLGDERYYRAVPIPPVSTFGQWNEPRNYGVTVTYNF